ncbi:MAG: type III-B CRISPR module-associated protein Cmr5 [Lentisphaeria bacterium]|nr:type III-B CRISPR module-associated protein Cmr5 [Lentisphaeria bacterium]
MNTVKNLDQIRAANAIKHAGDTFEGVDGGSIVKKIPPMIRDNGFLGALAFAVEKDKKDNPKNPGHYHVFECILEHLKKLNRIPDNCSDPFSLMEYLVESDSAKLRDVTAESLLYMNYLRRFVKPGKDN